MTKDTQTPLDKLGRHPEVKPPDYLPSPAPSLILYVSLLMFALALFASALRVGQERWSGFLSNLSTELIGAVIILLLVERRVRSSEMRFIQGLPETTRVVISDLFSPESREIRAYAHLLTAQLDLTSQHFHLHRADIETKLLTKRSEGLILIGSAGMGKTALLHELARVQSMEALKNPRRASVPILVPARGWDDGEAADVLRQTMRKFYPVSGRTFARLLERGRLVCLFDGVEDLAQPQNVVEKLKRFRARHPSNGVFISCRPLDRDIFEGLGLEKFVVPALTEDEVQTVLELRKGLAEGSD